MTERISQNLCRITQTGPHEVQGAFSQYLSAETEERLSGKVLKILDLIGKSGENLSS